MGKGAVTRRRGAMMGSVLTAALFTLAVPLAVQTSCLALELIAALVGRGRVAVSVTGARAVRCAVIIPAHDEEANLAVTLRSVKAQLAPTDRLVVVADNCSDDTAAIAAAEGAEVVERFDKLLIGKGYALDRGVRFLEADPPDIVVFIDADCVLGPECIPALVARSNESARPVQAKYLCIGERKSSKERIREFAFYVKNYVRALGGDRLGFPALLTGVGMAFPWPVIRDVKLASGHIVEDLKLGVDLALAGHVPLFCADAYVSSGFPVSAAGQNIQRTRWEHGHFTIIREYCSRLIAEAIRQRRPALLALALDIAVPPIGLLAVANAAASLAAAAVALAFGASAWLILPLLLLPVLILILGVTVSAFGRGLLRWSDAFVLPLYAFSKLPMLWSFFRNPQRLWIRSER
jgi:cellulose synthase/poly-beta-1,6-N-acetylglucosamine synthase-like glycosyltransferase